MCYVQERVTQFEKPLKLILKYFIEQKVALKNVYAFGSVFWYYWMINQHIYISHGQNDRIMDITEINL